MFKNPLKYQQGGKTQDPIGQLVKWLVQNTGLDENQISQRLEQILNDDTAKQKLVNNLQNMQKGDQNAAKNIIGMFVPQSAKFGGKIRDFICKHARGGKVDCGCKQEGGEIENKKPGYSVREERYPNGQLAGRDEYANGMIRGSLNPGTDDEWRWMGEEGSPFTIEPQSQRSRGPIIGTKYVNQNYWNWLNNQMDMARKYGTLDYKENGGKVEKHQGANGKIGVTNGQYQASDWENEFNQFTPTPGGGYARNYRLPMFGGHRWGIPGNTLRQVLVTYGDNGIPRKAVRDLKGYYGNGQIDTVIYDAYGNRHNSPEFEARVNRELEGMDPHQRPFQKETGGKVEKVQDGNILDFYKNKWSNDLSRIKFGWNKFKESAPGKVLSAFMPNPNSETGMLGAAAPIGKIKVIPEGKIGSLRRANYDPFVWEVVAKDPVVIENAKNLGLKEGSKEWVEFIEKTARDMDNLAKGMDFLSFKKGGIIQKNQNGSSSLGDFYRNKWKNDFFD